jgi:murein DD-endopeptidase MepM/ murein hydrolase activator NlpD
MEPQDPDTFRLRISLPGDAAPRWSATLDREGYRRWVRLLSALAVFLLLLAGTWGYLAARAWTAGALESRVAELEAERQRVEALSLALEAMERDFNRLRGLFSDGVSDTPALWLPPAGAAPGQPARPADDGEADPQPPTLWPLTERGFLTQGLIQSPEEDTDAGAGGSFGAGAHPGVDIAVPSGSYIRSVGEGVVVERGEDPVYGLFVVVEHPLGYRSLYAHASVVVVEPGRSVRAGQVLGLTGSSGRSTAPHLHLELTRDGVQIDPLDQLRRP